MLFWDIIFATIPGAFETPFQAAPLDIDTDTFYHSRRELFEKRLDEIKQGKAREIIRTVDLQHRDVQTLCIGVRWDLVEKEDLENIVEVRNEACFPPIYSFLILWIYSTLAASSCARFLESSLRNIAPEAAASRICFSGMTRRDVASLSKSRAPGTNSQKVKRFVELRFFRLQCDVNPLSRYRPGLTSWFEAAFLLMFAMSSRKARNLQRRSYRREQRRRRKRRRNPKPRARNGSAILTRTLGRKKNGLNNLARRALKMLGAGNLGNGPKNPSALNQSNPIPLAILPRSCNVV
jgi:hypothetical protein